MKTLKVPDMHCEKCVARITKALTDKGMDFTVSLESRTVSVEDARVAAAVEVLDDIGFDAAE